MIAPTGKEDRAEEVERAKHEQLREQKEGKGQWKDELASDSESIVCVCLSLSTSTSMSASSSSSLSFAFAGSGQALS